MPVMSDTRAQDREWIAGILRERGWKATDLARRAGVNQTTLTRFLHKPDHPYSLSERTRSAIARTIGLAASTPTPPARQPATGFFEPDAVEYDPAAPVTDMVLADILQGYDRTRPHLARFVLKTHALETLGWFPGDVLLVDINEPARQGDLVCAQIYDWPRNRADTVFRIYQAPFLMTGAKSGKLTPPLIVDNQNIVIKGTVITTLRPRVGRVEQAA
jgi:lambda repressor-like predicted transcriptional regulator